MKTRNLLPAILLVSLVMSCKSPQAYFDIQEGDFQTFQQISFYNKSTDAYSFLWDFGDDSTSTQEYPKHVYYIDGTFTVKLTAFSENGKKSDEHTEQLVITHSTDLAILVVDNVTGNPVPECLIILYATETDWQNSTNEVGAGLTGPDGILYLVGGQPIVYYLDAYKELASGYYSNNGLKYKTDPLEANKINEEIVYVNFFTQSRKSVALPKIDGKVGFGSLKAR